MPDPSYQKLTPDEFKTIKAIMKATTSKHSSEIQEITQQKEAFFGIDDRKKLLERIAYYKIDCDIIAEILARYGYPN